MSSIISVDNFAAVLYHNHSCHRKTSRYLDTCVDEYGESFVSTLVSIPFCTHFARHFLSGHVLRSLGALQQNYGGTVLALLALDLSSLATAS